MYTKQSLTKAFLIAIAVFVFWGWTAEAKDSLPKQADAFGWKSSPLIPASTVGILGQPHWLRVSAVQDSHLSVSLNPAGLFNHNDTKTDSASESAYFFVKDRKDSGGAFEGGCCGFPGLRSKFFWGALAGFLGAHGGDEIGGRVGIGTFWGFMGGTFIGSSSGVYLYGRLSGETGSYWATLIGSALGTSGVVLAATSFSGGLSVVAFIAHLVLPAAGATIGFNMTKGKEQKDSAAISLEGGDISFAFTSLQMQVRQIPNHRPETEYALRLVDVKF
ncbi:hypothetical protein FJZ31_12200 [Candidatus Poribacteria bacterium]|nr:hypothetical protein [Candidatus Poribacteria bacterium]